MKLYLLLIFAFTWAILPLSAQIDQGAMLDAINELRAEGCTCGTSEIKPVTSVSWNKDLAEIAKSYSDHLKDNNKSSKNNFLFLSHVGIDGSTLESRLAEANFNTKFACENIAFIKGNENTAIDYWLNNPESCQNIMSKQSTALGAARSGDFWVLILAQPIIKSKKDKTQENITE